MSDGKPKHIHVVAPPHLNDEASRHAYRVAYRKAADSLVLRALHEKLSDTERAGIIYPIMFLYRHCVEITLKDLLALSSMATITRQDKILGHDLSELWINILALVEVVQGKKMRDEFDESFSPLVLAMHAADPKGDAFRYPLDRAGRPHWPQPFDVDIVNIKIWVKAFEAWCREIEGDLRKRLS